MEIRARVTDLPALHPRLQWSDIVPAAAAVLYDRTKAPRVVFRFETINLPLFSGEWLGLVLDFDDVARETVERIRRTYEPPRLIELTAIAIAGLAIHHAGGHEIRDLAARGSMSDYVIDETRDLLEVAGRSRRSDLESAWRVRYDRLRAEEPGCFYVCVCEFETMSGRLGFSIT